MSRWKAVVKEKIIEARKSVKKLITSDSGFTDSFDEELHTHDGRELQIINQSDAPIDENVKLQSVQEENRGESSAREQQLLRTPIDEPTHEQSTISDQPSTSSDDPDSIELKRQQFRSANSRNVELASHPNDLETNQITEKPSESVQTQTDSNSSKMNVVKEINLRLPDEPSKLEKELGRFEALCEANQIGDAVRVTKLYAALQRSPHFADCDEFIGTDELSSYDKLKTLVLQRVKPVVVDEWKALLNPSKPDPLGTYNRIKHLKPDFTDKEIVPFLQPHLHWSTYMTLLSTDWSTADRDLRSHIVQYLEGTKGAQSIDLRPPPSQPQDPRQSINSDAMHMYAQLMEKLDQVVERKLVNVAAVEQHQINQQQPANSGLETTLTNLTNTVANLQAQINNIGAGQNHNNRGRFKPKPQLGECDYHKKHQDEAFQCRPPCKKFNPQKFYYDRGNGVYIWPEGNPWNRPQGQFNPNNQYGQSTNGYQRPNGPPANGYNAPPGQPNGRMDQQNGQSNHQQSHNLEELLGRLTTLVTDLSRARSGQDANQNF